MASMIRSGGAGLRGVGLLNGAGLRGVGLLSGVRLLSGVGLLSTLSLTARGSEEMIRLSQSAPYSETFSCEVRAEASVGTSWLPRARPTATLVVPEEAHGPERPEGPEKERLADKGPGSCLPLAGMLLEAIDLHVTSSLTDCVPRADTLGRLAEEFGLPWLVLQRGDRVRELSASVLHSEASLEVEQDFSRRGPRLHGGDRVRSLSDLIK